MLHLRLLVQPLLQELTFDLELFSDVKRFLDAGKILLCHGVLEVRDRVELPEPQRAPLDRLHAPECFGAPQDDAQARLVVPLHRLVHFVESLELVSRAQDFRQILLGQADAGRLRQRFPERRKIA
jgi:hypothetical protein